MPAHVSRPLIAHVIYCLAQACPRHAAPSVAAGASPPRPLSARSPRPCLRACRMRLPGMSGLMCRVTAPQLPFITELPEVPRAEVRTCLAWSEPGVVTSTMRCGWAGAAPRPPSALETAIVALQATLDMMARWGQSAQARFRHPRLLAELEALLAERQSGPLLPPARRPAISVHRASTHAVAGAGTCLDNFEAQIAERWADWRRGEVPADEARLSCETCASTSGPAATPAARARGTRHTQCVVVAAAARRLLAQIKKARDERLLAPCVDHQDRFMSGCANLASLMGALEVSRPTSLRRSHVAAVAHGRRRRLFGGASERFVHAERRLAGRRPRGSRPPSRRRRRRRSPQRSPGPPATWRGRPTPCRRYAGQGWPWVSLAPAARTKPDVGRGGVARCCCRCATGPRSSFVVLARRGR